MAVPGSARRATSVRMGSKCCSCPSLEEEQPSEAAVLPCSAAQGEQWHYSAAYPCRHGHCCCPAELRHQGTVLAFPLTVAGGHFCGISFPVCLSRVANPHRVLRRGGTCLCIQCKRFLWTPNKALPLWPQPLCTGHIVQNVSQVTPLPLLCPMMAAWLFCIQFCISTFSVLETTLRFTSDIPVC